MLVNKTILSFCLIFFSLQVVAQKGTNSPYSVYGIGELSVNPYATYAGMAGVQMANADSTSVNYLNPAMYSYHKRYKPIFQVAVNGRISRFETASSLIDKNAAGLNQFHLGLPIKKNWGAAMGLMPYSFSGYEIKNHVIEDGDSLQQFVNEGSGGISQFYMGVSHKLIDFSYPDTNIRKRGTKMAEGKAIARLDTNIVYKRQVLSLGINGKFLFGSAKRKRSYEYLVWPTSTPWYNSRVENGLRVSDVLMDIGLNYQYYFHTDSSAGSFSLGATYTPARKARAFQDLYSYNYLGSFYEAERPVTVYDTIQFVENNQGEILIPESYNVGIEYRFGPGHRNPAQLRLALDMKFQKWARYYEEFDSIRVGDQMRDRLSLGFGLEYVPNTTYAARNTVPFFGTIRYRLGFNYTQTELFVPNNLGERQQIIDYGMSFGLGIPIAVNYSNTSINFGATFGNLGTTENGLIRERYVGIYFGLSLTPGRGNFWFVKRKYD